MAKKIKILIFLSILPFLLMAGLIFIIQDTDNDNLSVHYSYFSNKDFFEEAFEQGEGQIKEIENEMYGGILPHHLIVKDKIAAFLGGLGKYDYQTIVLIGPNHLSIGSNKIITSKLRWNTPYGYLEPDLNLIDALESSSVVEIEEPPFDKEHSIAGLVGFIKNYFPETKFVPIILKISTTPQQSSDLARAIFNNVKSEKTLILASVDFSHYQPVNVADFHDLRSNSVIQSFDFERIYDLEIDSPPSIYTLLKYLEFSGAQKNDLIFSTNSGVLIGKNDIPTTSHNFFYFRQGEKSQENLINFLFFGDLMLDRNVGKTIKENGLDYIFEDLAVEENRFFQGIDVVAANLEGAVTNGGAHYKPDFAYDFAFAPDLIDQLKKYNFNFFNLANNHFSDQGEKGIIETRENLNNLRINYSGCPDGELGECSSAVIEATGKKIGMIGLSMVYSLIDIEKAKGLIKDLKNISDFVIVNIHWGAEYVHRFNQIQQQTAHNLIDAGADVVIGHHPHVVQEIEIYNSKPIFYSLGNFIFDQYFSQDTQEGLGIGLSIGNQIKIFIYPLRSELGKLRLMIDNEKKEFLNKLISWSSIDNIFIEQIKTGRIELK